VVQPSRIEFQNDAVDYLLAKHYRKAAGRFAIAIPAIWCSRCSPSRVSGPSAGAHAQALDVAAKNYFAGL